MAKAESYIAVIIFQIVAYFAKYKMQDWFSLNMNFEQLDLKYCIILYNLDEHKIISE